MATKREITYDLLNVVRQGQIANSEPISEEQLSFWIDNTRVTLIKQDLDKRRSVNPDIIQTLCAELEVAEASTCPCIVTGCTILKTKLPIPNALETHYRNLIISVGPAVITAPRFSLIDYHRAIYYNPNKFSNSVPAVFLYNHHLFIIAETNKYDMLENISIEIVLERPEEAAAFSCTGTPCYSDTSKYPLATWMIEPLKAMIIQNNLKIASTAPSDQLGDAKHELQQNIEK